MTRRRWVFGSLAVVLVAAAVVVRYVGDPVMIRFPLNIDQTEHYTGTATVSADPATLAPLAKPMTFPLQVDRTVKVVSGSYSRAVIDETVKLRFAGTTQSDTYRYVMDRRSMQLVTSPDSYALGNKANRMAPAGSYRINLELGANGVKSYKLFAPETDSAATAVPTGPAHHSAAAGTDVIRYNTTLDAPLAPYYLASIQRSGFPAQLTAAQAAAQLQAQGVNLSELVQQVTPFLTASQLTQLQQAVSQPVPLSYHYFQNGWVEIEPTTGALISSSSREGVSVAPDLSGLHQLVTALAPLGNLSAVKALSAAYTTLSAAGHQPALTLAFDQTPASVASSVSLARDQAQMIALVRWQLPLGLAVLGLLALLLAVFWRPRRPAQVTALPVTRPVQPPAAQPPAAQPTRRPA